MKKISKVIACILMVVMVCSNIGTTSVQAANMTAQQIINKSVKNSSKIKSYTLKASINATLKSGGEKATIKLNETASYTKSPFRMKMVMDMNVSGEQQKQTVYYTKKGSKYYGYQKVNGSWVSGQMDASTGKSLAQNNPCTVLKEAKKYMSSIKLKSKTSKVNGTSCYVITAKLDMEKMYAGMENETNGQLDASLFKGKKIPVTYWIDKNTMIPVKYTMEMSNTYNDLLKSLLGQDVKLTKFSSTVTYSKINKTKVTLPSGVK